jgi:hypothetical protein
MEGGGKDAGDRKTRPRRRGVCATPQVESVVFLCADLFAMSPPFCLALVLCDAVHRDPSTGKFTLLGLYETVFATQFPIVHPVTLYFAITDGVGPVRLAIRVVDSAHCPSGPPPPPPIDVGNVVEPSSSISEDGVLAVLHANPTFSSPLDVFEEAVSFDLPFAHEGIYACELWANDELLMARRITAQTVPGTQRSL